ncbi:hypothetical protein BMF77_02027 [Dolichospermum sp. UHCC 0315A]|nr:hypothetical protein BMF77_02027 [Dolichospermum sp. UHCC 0315A]
MVWEWILEGSAFIIVGAVLEGSALNYSRGRASVIAFPVRDWERDFK